MRREVIGDCELWLGDAKDVLPLVRDQVGAVCTDPPYGIGAGTGIGKVTKQGSDFRHKAQWDDHAPDLGFVIDLDVPSIIWGGNYFGLPASTGFLVWDKVQPEKFTLAMAELAWTNVKTPAKIWRWKSQSINSGAAKFHPTQKPLGLMEWCLGFLPESKTILDCYLGSGTTLVACAKLGRKGIGIELDPDYFDIACERVRKAYEQPDFFIEQAKQPEPQQEDMGL